MERSRRETMNSKGEENVASGESRGPRKEDWTEKSM